MSDASARTFSSDFRRFFLRGLVVLLPTVLTLWIVVQAYRFVDNNIAEPVNQGIRLAMSHTARLWTPLGEVFDPTEDEVTTELAGRNERALDRATVEQELRSANIRDWWQSRWYMDLIGLVVAIIAVYIAGRLLGGLIGRRIYRGIERFITTLPVFKQVYPHVKQIVDFLFSDERSMKFNRVVVVEYPRKGIWSVGFMTGDTLRSVAERAGDAVTVFVPSSPTPFTGYTITVPRDEVRELPITVEEAIRFAVSGGVLVPEHQAVRAQGPAGQLDAAPDGLIPIDDAEGLSEEDSRRQRGAG